MPALISYIIIRVSVGFALGAATAVAILTQSLIASHLSIGLPEMLLTIYGFGSTFGMGYLATSLAFDAQE